MAIERNPLSGSGPSGEIGRADLTGMPPEPEARGEPTSQPTHPLSEKRDAAGDNDRGNARFVAATATNDDDHRQPRVIDGYPGQQAVQAGEIGRREVGCREVPATFGIVPLDKGPLPEKALYEALMTRIDSMRSMPEFLAVLSPRSASDQLPTLHDIDPNKWKKPIAEMIERGHVLTPAEYRDMVFRVVSIGGHVDAGKRAAILRLLSSSMREFSSDDLPEVVDVLLSEQARCWQEAGQSIGVSPGPEWDDFVRDHVDILITIQTALRRMTLSDIEKVTPALLRHIGLLQPERHRAGPLGVLAVTLVRLNDFRTGERFPLSKRREWFQLVKEEYARVPLSESGRALPYLIRGGREVWDADEAQTAFDEGLSALCVLDRSNLRNCWLETLGQLADLVDRMPEGGLAAATHKLMHAFDSLELDSEALRESIDDASAALWGIGNAIFALRAAGGEVAGDEEVSWLLRHIRDIDDESAEELLLDIGGEDAFPDILGVVERMRDEAERAAATAQLGLVLFHERGAQPFAHWFQLAEAIPRMLKTETARTQAFALLRSDRLRDRVDRCINGFWPREARALLDKPESVGQFPFVPVVESEKGKLVPRTQ